MKNLFDNEKFKKENKSFINEMERVEVNIKIKNLDAQIRKYTWLKFNGPDVNKRLYEDKLVSLYQEKKELYGIK